MDTDVFLSLLDAQEARRIADKYLDRLEEADHAFLSAASIFEVNQKIRRAKLRLPYLDDARLKKITARGIEVVACDTGIMANAGALEWTYKGADHRDPFDRMILATALAQKAAVMSSDAAFGDAPDCRWMKV